MINAIAILASVPVLPREEWLRFWIVILGFVGGVIAIHGFCGTCTSWNPTKAIMTCFVLFVLGAGVVSHWVSTRTEPVLLRPVVGFIANWMPSGGNVATQQAAPPTKPPSGR